MIYLEKFIFPDLDNDNIRQKEDKGSFYGDTYPYHITSTIGLWSLDFEPITILYGNNGSGKSTILNVIARKLCADRKSMYNTSVYFDSYVEKCQYKSVATLAGESLFSDHREPQKYDISQITTVLTSDDIFHMMNEQRMNNDKRLHKSKFLEADYYQPDKLPKHLDLETGYNVDAYIKGVEARKARSFNQFLLNSVGKIERGFSNGETALMKLTEILEQPGIYLLDEPENSMSCDFQTRLASTIAYLARHGDCQFIISSHSPFILSLEEAKIYNLDHSPVDICKWWELENMRTYFQLFEEAREYFIHS